MFNNINLTNINRSRLTNMTKRNMIYIINIKRSAPMKNALLQKKLRQQTKKNNSVVPNE